MVELLILADDFTGALDTGVQFASWGARTKVVTRWTRERSIREEEVQVLCIDTETRHLPADQAHRIVADIVAWAADVPCIYKKTDSALRGNVGAELSAVVAASGQDSLVFVPAFPQIGRCTVNGVHYIDGVPVADSVFGREPFNPVRNSSVEAIIHEQCGLPVRAAQPGQAPPELPGVCVYDAREPEDLARIADTLAARGGRRLLAGCAGFASVLPGLLGLQRQTAGRRPVLSERLLVICGSLNPITVEQMDVAERAGFVRVRLRPEHKLDPDYWEQGRSRELIAGLQRTLAENPHMIIDSNDACGNRLTAAFAQAHQLTVEEVRRRISRTLGCILGALFDSEALGTLLITGGDTLMECMNTMGVHEMEPLCELLPGVVLSRFGYKGKDRYVITKSGGFGRKDLIVDLLGELGPRAPEQQIKGGAL